MWAHRGWQLPTSQKKRPRNETYLASILILNFSASRTMRNKCLSLEPPNPWYFVRQPELRQAVSTFFLCSPSIPKDSPLLEEAGGLVRPLMWAHKDHKDGRERGEVPQHPLCGSGLPISGLRQGLAQPITGSHRPHVRTTWQCLDAGWGRDTPGRRLPWEQGL